MPLIPPELGSQVSTRSYTWSEIPQRAWGSEFRAPDHGIYEFSNGRKFDSTDKYKTGVYGGGVPGDTLLVLDGQQYPDMRDGVYAEVGIRQGAADSGFGSYQEILADPRT
jgi:hypothetical protein